MKFRSSRLGLVAGVSLVALSLAGCASSKTSASSNDKAGSGATTTSMAAAHAAGAHDMGNMGPVLAGTATGDSPCEKASPKPASPGQANASGASGTDAEGSHGGRGMLKQLPMTHAERVLLAKQMIQARSVIDKYPTVKVAEAAGYRMSTVFVPCIGAHYTNMKLLYKFDPAAPSELLFDGTTPDSKIIGLSYLVFHPGGAPEGFAGPNDHFHQHNANGGLCLKGGTVIGGEDMMPADCVKAGGSKSAKLMADVWMAHAWVAPGWECTWGVFAGECPELGGRLGGNAFDTSKS